MKLGNGQKASYLANYRYSTLEVLDKLAVQRRDRCCNT